MGAQGSSLAIRISTHLKSHPIICLLLLTPGIPEYLSSSSPMNAILLNPFQFMFQILANLGLYGSGALLIHDARVRWNKGWATVLLLGAAYGILEEGVALSTMFDPKAGPVGTLGVYGHWLGVNWVWSAGIVPFHALWSISIPILLLGLALPDTTTKTLLTRRGTAVTLVVLAVDVLLLMIIVNHASGYWMGTPVLLGSLFAIAFLIFLARRAPPTALKASTSASVVSAKRLVAIGISFFPVVLFSQALGESGGLPPTIDFVLVLVLQALYLVYLTHLNWSDNQRGMVALAIGLVIPIMVFGILAELALPMTLIADAAAYFFFRKVWTKHAHIPRISVS